MPTTYVLIALLTFNGGAYQQDSKMPLAAEFNTLDACQAAADWIHTNDKHAPTLCTSKGSK